MYCRNYGITILSRKVRRQKMRYGNVPPNRMTVQRIVIHSKYHLVCAHFAPLGTSNIVVASCCSTFMESCLAMFSSMLVTRLARYRAIARVSN